MTDDGLFEARKQVVEQAREEQRRASRLNRRLSWVVALVFVALLVTSTVITLSKFSDTDGRLLRISRTNAQALQIIRSYTSPAAQKASAAALTQLIACVDNRMDYDTGHAAAILPGCPAAAPPIGTTSP